MQTKLVLVQEASNIYFIILGGANFDFRFDLCTCSLFSNVFDKKQRRKKSLFPKEWVRLVYLIQDDVSFIPNFFFFEKEDQSKKFFYTKECRPVDLEKQEHWNHNTEPIFLCDYCKKP